MSSAVATSTPNKSPITNTRSNTALHVCWHRGATVALKDFLTASENQLSGYLLRKFKNSSGWQKLWVVFTSFCLYFYKNYQDEFALASLPLLGWVRFFFGFLFYSLSIIYNYFALNLLRRQKNKIRSPVHWIKFVSFRFADIPLVRQARKILCKRNLYLNCHSKITCISSVLKVNIRTIAG